MHTVALVGWGKAVPEHCVSQQEAADFLLSLAPPGIRQREERWHEIFEHSGIHKRHTVVTRNHLTAWHTTSTLPVDNPAGTAWAEVKKPPTKSVTHEGNHCWGPSTAQRLALYTPAATDLAVRAAQRALLDADCAGKEVTHLITASCTGFHAPGVDVQLVKRLGLAAEVKRVHIGYMGCHAAINALRTAQAFLASEPDACVLVCCVEVCSLHWQQMTNTSIWLGNVLFADGAAALVLRSVAAPGYWQLLDTASTLLTDSEHVMSWTIGDHGFEMYVSSQLPALLRSAVGRWLEQWLRRGGWDVTSVASWAVHPGGPKILQAVAESLKLGPEALRASQQVLAQFGNMSSPSVLFVLDQLRQDSAPRPCVALAFGPGLTLEAALFI